MLWSQFSAIFANFRRKNWRFSQKNIVMNKFLQKVAAVSAKNRQIFRRKYFKNHNIGPCLRSLSALLLCSVLR
jgi:hypothetical protein